MSAKRLLCVLLLAAAGSSGIALSGEQKNTGEDCIRYKPANLTITDQGAAGWRLDSPEAGRLFRLDNSHDAELALAVGKQYSSLCYIGRNNKRADREHYVLYYWKK